MVIEREVKVKTLTLTRQTYRVEEAAALLGIGRNGAYEAIARGDLPAIRLGKRLVIAKTTINRMLGLTDRSPVATDIGQ
jgi:excisionase family DNA binding protein